MRHLSFNHAWRGLHPCATMRMIVYVICLLFSTTLYAEPVLVRGQWLEQHLGNTDIALIDMSADQVQYQHFYLPGACVFLH
ncbi:MAG: hypothetical protein BMS9Abin15_0458 [Gammaproteobacteria bacterium]|nr:MAG: hypothetical protein BMS9Abin15_0458 [Gammaproteobacteria bacterium]